MTSRLMPWNLPCDAISSQGSDTGLRSQTKAEPLLPSFSICEPEEKGVNSWPSSCVCHMAPYDTVAMHWLKGSQSACTKSRWDFHSSEICLLWLLLTPGVLLSDFILLHVRKKIFFWWLVWSEESWFSHVLFLCFDNKFMLVSGLVFKPAAQLLLFSSVSIREEKAGGSSEPEVLEVCHDHNSWKWLLKKTWIIVASVDANKERGKAHKIPPSRQRTTGRNNH